MEQQKPGKEGNHERTWIHFPVLTSTNTYIKEKFEHLADRTVVTADSQTAGKGRRGKNWMSDDGSSLYMSVLLKRIQMRFSISGICGTAVCLALEQEFGETFSIKWPNDIILKEKKVAGILCELVMDQDTPAFVCGIGVNLNQTEKTFHTYNLPYAGSLYMLLGKKSDKKKIAEKIVKQLDRLLITPHEKQMDEYRKRQVLLGRTVSISDGRHGMAVDITEEGLLILQTENGKETVLSGEVSVRGGKGYL